MLIRWDFWSSESFCCQNLLTLDPRRKIATTAMKVTVPDYVGDIQNVNGNHRRKKRDAIPIA